MRQATRQVKKTKPKTELSDELYLIKKSEGKINSIMDQIEAGCKPEEARKSFKSFLILKEFDVSYTVKECGELKNN